jgi:PAS domain S-box-containing protein
MGGSAYREELYDAFADCGRDTGARIEQALDIGRGYLDLSVGFLTRISDGEQEVVRATGDDSVIQRGETCPLEEAYCQRTVETTGPLAVQSAVPSESIAEAAVERFGLGTYIGSRVVVDDEVFGTVCFGDPDQREQPFSEAEELFLELLAKLVGQALERRRYEQELEARNDRLEREIGHFQGIARNSFDVLFRIGTDGRYTYISSAIERILGYEPETMLGEPFTTFLAEQYLDDALEAFARVLDGEPVEGLEMDFRHTDGECVTIEVNSTPLLEDGEVAGVQGVGRDVTARREREEELRLKNRAMDEAQVGVAIASHGESSCPVVYVNQGFEQLTGYTAAEALGEDCRFFFGEAADPETVDLIEAAVSGGEPSSAVVVNRQKDGTPFWSQIRVSPIENRDGTVSHHLVFQADVTERERTGRLVQLLNRVLRHNLRNEMNVVIGRGELLRETDDRDIAEDIDAIVETAWSVIELSEHARQLEAVARRDRKPRRLAPDELLETVAADARRQFPDATVEVDIRTERDICAGTELEEALAELVENGLKHDTSPAPAVCVGIDDDDEWVELTVTDCGPGIAEMEQSVIASGEETPLQHGTGMGLWLVNWVVTRYGGSFQIRSAGPETEGSVATVRLPGLGPEESVAAAERGPTVLFR